MGLNPLTVWTLWWSTMFLGASKVLMDAAEQMEGDE
jgi:hypothetical protein